MANISLANNKIWIEPNANHQQVFKAMFGSDPGEFSGKTRMIIRHNASANQMAENSNQDIKTNYDKSLVLPVEFSFDSKELTKESKDFLTKVYAASTGMQTEIGDKHKVILDISSHTDSIGPANYNQSLSEIRAETVKKYLLNKGLTAEINTKGYGESQLLDKNNPSSSKNRRVEISAKIVKI
jgi:outer membrane protein OmpA-like peptidoglycan-associated protein